MWYLRFPVIFMISAIVIAMSILENRKLKRRFLEIYHLYLDIHGQHGG